MSEQKFNIYFKGEIVPGADENAVKANVGKLFKANEKVLARLFSGSKIEIKKGVDKAGAMKYRALLKKAGAICYAEPVGGSITEAPKAPSPVGAVKTAASEPAQEAQDESGLSLAPAGAILVEPKPAESIPLPDISGITLAPIGVDLIDEVKELEAPVVPDVSGIDLAPAGSDMGQIIEEKELVNPDVSAIDMAELGADMADPVEEVVPPMPDTSDIDIAPPGVTLIEPSEQPEAPDLDLSHMVVEEPK